MTSGNGRVLVGHGADNTDIEEVDIINVDDCPPPIIDDLEFNEVKPAPPDSPLDLSADAYGVGISDDDCVSAVGTLIAPVVSGVATLLIAVDQQTEDGIDNLEPAVYALIGEASGEIPTLPAATDGAGGEGGAGGAGGAGGTAGSGGTITPDLLCDQGLCEFSDVLKEQCEDFVEACIVAGNQPPEDCFLAGAILCNPEGGGR